jgi:hypothetical protein
MNRSANGAEYRDETDGEHPIIPMPDLSSTPR